MRRRTIRPMVMSLEDRALPNSLIDLLGLPFLGSMFSLLDRPAAMFSWAAEFHKPGDTQDLTNLSLPDTALSERVVEQTLDLVGARDRQKEVLTTNENHGLPPRNRDENTWLSGAPLAGLSFDLDIDGRGATGPASTLRLGGIQGDHFATSQRLIEPVGAREDFPPGMQLPSPSAPLIQADALSPLTTPLLFSSLPSTLKMDHPSALKPIAGHDGSNGPPPDPHCFAEGGWVCFDLNGAIPVNADNDNGSQVTNGFPARRDFDVSPIPDGDPDLVRGRLDYGEPGTGGTLTFTTTRNRDAKGNFGTGEIAIWDSPSKTRRLDTSALPEAQIPDRFYVEGVYPSSFIGDLQLTITYTYTDILGTHTPSDDEALTITPLVDEFAVTPPAPEVVWIDNARPWLGATVGGARGAVIEARVIDDVSRGQPLLFQNLIELNNRVGGASAGITQNRDIFPNIDMFISDQLPRCAGAHFPILDARRGRHYPDITVHSEHQGYSWFIDSRDFPSIQLDDDRLFPEWVRNLGDIYLVNVQYKFRDYVVWQYPPSAASRSVYYTLAMTDWQVTFQLRNTQGVRGGVNQIVVPGSGVTSGPFFLSHVEPSGIAVTEPLANECLSFTSAR